MASFLRSRPARRRNEGGVSLSHSIGGRDSETGGKIETTNETMAETADLKSLARRVLQRDTKRDRERDRSPRGCLEAPAMTRQMPEGVSVSRWPKGETPRQAATLTYARTFAAFQHHCPNQIETADWELAVEDGQRFLAQWGNKAEALGWTARDLFGLSPVPTNYRRLSCYDERGLIWLLDGRPVVALTGATAAIKNPTGAITIYRRYNKPAICPMGDSLDDFDP